MELVDMIKIWEWKYYIITKVGQFTILCVKIVETEEGSERVVKLGEEDVLLLMI